MSDNDHGVVIMAYSRRRFAWQAQHLAMSLRLHSPDLPLALVTDMPHKAKPGLFDIVIPMTGQRRTDCRPKLDLDLHTPFDHTLYLDSDALAVRDISFIFDRFTGHDFAVMGSNINTGHWYGDVPEMCARAGASTIPKFSGGFLYFTRTNTTAATFADARAQADTYTESGYDRFNNGIADEPILSIALARQGIQAIPTMPDTAISLIGLTSDIDLDVTTGRARFTKNHRPMNPAIVHFAADYSSPYRWAGRHYRRQCRKLRLGS